MEEEVKPKAKQTKKGKTAPVNAGRVKKERRKRSDDAMEDDNNSEEEEEEDQEALMAKKMDFYRQVDNEEFF